MAHVLAWTNDSIVFLKNMVIMNDLITLEV
jgi:hypothetical protein